MTREDRWVVSLDEIQAIRWECRNCHAAVSIAINQTIKFPEACPVCTQGGLDSNFVPAHKAYPAFVSALKSIIQDQQKENGAAPGILQLEFLTGPATRR